MKYLLLAVLGCLVTSCSPQVRQAMRPNHFGVSPSCEFEIQKGYNTVYKPKITTNIDWNF